MRVLKIHDLRKTYPAPGPVGRPVVALDGVDLDVAAGEVLGLVGHSGSGKSSLLRCLALLEEPDSGRITFNGQDVLGLTGPDLQRAGQRVALVTGSPELLASRSVADNVASALDAMDLSDEARRHRVGQVLDLVGLGGLATAYPPQLSGGRQRRIALARALATGPDILLSDEAILASDAEGAAGTADSIAQRLRGLARELGLAVVLATHERDLVKQICDSAAVLRKGRITESGKVLDLLSEAGSELAQGLFPLPPVAQDPGSTLVDLTFVGETATQPFVSVLARTYAIDVNILGGSVEQVGDDRIGRLRIALPGSPEVNAAQLAYLRDSGLIVHVHGERPLEAA